MARTPEQIEQAIAERVKNVPQKYEWTDRFIKRSLFTPSVISPERTPEQIEQAIAERVKNVPQKYEWTDRFAASLTEPTPLPIKSTRRSQDLAA